MRLEYNLQLSKIGVPRFAVEAQEGIGKIFTLATVVLNVLDDRPRVEIIFHGLNPEDPPRKIRAFRDIIESAETASFSVEEGASGRVAASSSYFQWLIVKK